MHPNKFIITGHIIDRQTGRGISGLRIEAWDKDLFFDDLVGSAETDAEGFFAIRFNEEHFKELIARRPDLYFRLFVADEAIPGEAFELTVTPPHGEPLSGTGDSVFWKLAPGETKVSIRLALPAASQIFKVKGTILQPDGTPVSGATVKAFDKDLRHEEELGEVSTNQAGEYEITYTREQFHRAEKKNADLIVRAFDEQGQVLAASSVLFNAAAVVKINLTVNAGLSEFERITEALGSLLKIDNVSLTDLGEEDVTFLSGETGFSAQWLQILADAARVAAQVDFALSEDDETAIFYGLGRKAQPMVLHELLSKDLFVLRKVLENALDENIIPDYLSASLDAIFEALDQLADASAQEKPIYYIDVQQKRLRSLGDFIGLDPAKMNTLINRAVTFAGVNDTALGALVEADELQMQEAKAVGLAVSLYHLLDADLQLTQALMTASFPQLSQGTVSRVEDLVILDKTDWSGILAQADTTLPNDFTIEEYAALLTRKVEILYPSDALMARLIRTDDEAVRTDMERMQPLFEKNETIIGVDRFEDLDTKGIQADVIKTLRKSHARLVGYANSYKALNLKEIIDNQALSADDKAMQIVDRIGLLTQFQTQNQDKEFLTLDYSPDSADIQALNFYGFSEVEQQMTLTCLKAYQRVYSISEDIQQSQMMMTAGYDSAWAITNDNQQDYQTNTGMSVTNAESSYQSAVATVENTTTKFGAIIEIFQAGVRRFEDIEDYLKKIPGFEDLFGSQDYCQCQHCQSILSPAAYFVDLMSFIDRWILSTNFNGDLQNHVLNLKTRRADLWSLPLTCENTHDMVPYLEIINEILENHIYIMGHADAVGELPERDDIEKYVYKNVINVDKDSVRSFQQPVLLPLAKLEIYLSHFDVTRGEIARLLEMNSALTAAAVLSLSAGEYQLVTEVKEAPGFLKGLYGIDFEIDANSGGVTRFDAQKLLSPMGLTRPELGELVETQYVQSSSPDQIQIIGEKLEPEQDVQNNVENIYGLTTASLDHMHRFIRLWRQLSWTIAELDLVLLHFPDEEDEELSNGIDADTPLQLVTLLEVQQRFGISAEELCTLWSHIPCRKVTGNDQALFDRLFNLPDFVLMDGRYPKQEDKFIHPAFQSNDPEQNNDLHRLLAGLRIDDEQLYLLITRLSSPLGLNLDPDPDNPEDKYEPGFYLNVVNLSLLYRHARLAQWLKIEITQLFQLVDQNQVVEQGHIGDLNELSALLRYYDWWKSTDYSVDDIAYIVQAETYPEAEDLAGQLKDAVRAEGALTFADTVFSYLKNITEDQSKIIIETNSGWITSVPDSSLYWLSSSFNPSKLEDTPAALTFATSIFSLLEGVSPKQSRLIVDANHPAFIKKIEIQNPHGRTKTVGCLTDHFNPESTLVIPPGIDVTEANARALLIAYFAVTNAEGISSLLMAYHASEVVPTYLVRKQGIEVEKSKAFIEIAGVDMSAPDFVSALQNTGEEIKDLVEKILPLGVLFHAKTFKSDSLHFIFENREQAGLFEISDFNALTVVDIQRISQYASFIPDAEHQSSLRDLHDVLLAFDLDQKYANADNVKLAAVLNAEPGLVLTLEAQLSLPATALEALDKLRHCVDLIKYLGVGAEAIGLLVSEDYDALAQASEAILGVFRAKYSDEDEWEEKVAPYRDKIRTIKRNALTDFMIHSDDYAWCESHSDLYYYFLIDVELEGCALTSKVVAAISSLQLYVHRVLLNLEQSQDGNVLVIPDDPKEFKKEWQWRKNYRVWEANRKVFLFPENWIEPGLRDNKTPLFEALESELLQQEINEQTVLDAYANYMRGFEEVSHLKIAGSYHEKDEHSKKDILHLFGVTADEPPIYYYRGIENAHYGERESNRGIVWSPWRKIDVQIPVSKVSPVIFRGRLHVFWVEFTTRPKNEVKDGDSKFVGYQHKMSLKYTSLRLDGTWTTPQSISLYDVDPFKKGDGVIEDPLKDDNESTLAYIRASQEYPNPGSSYWNYLFEKYLQEYYKTPRYDDEIHAEPMDGYTLTGYGWDQVYPVVFEDEEGIEQLVVTGRDWEMVSAPVDFYERSIKKGQSELFRTKEYYDPVQDPMYSLLHSHVDNGQQRIKSFAAGYNYIVDYIFASVFIDHDKAKNTILQKIDSVYLTEILADLAEEGNHELGNLPKAGKLSVVNGSIQDVIIDLSGDLFLLAQKAQVGDYWLRRLDTTLSEQVARTLFTRGVNGLLDIETQKAMIEKPSPMINKVGDRIDDSYLHKENTDGEKIPDFSGSFGLYYQEIFFQIPFLIANHLNSQQKFSAAQKWYHYIFDPTASEEVDDFGSGPTPNPEEVEKRQRDRNWRYIEFRNHDIEKLRDLLTDDDTIEVYRKDPFNPHAIARLRLTAYQKTIVMKYIDNLLDWGDQLFAQDTMESINEATLLYILASDILGERPAELGDCAEIPTGSRTYESIKPLLNEDSPFLIEMEHWVGSSHAGNFASELKDSYEYSIDPAVAANASASAQMTTIESEIEEWPMSASIVDQTKTTDFTKQAEVGELEGQDYQTAGLSLSTSWSNANQVYEEYQPQQWQELVRQITTVFCIPENKGLKQYWDRVEDRLNKVRNCMNISGIRRQLALFAPEIDPGLLVRAKAAGLSVEDVLNAISGNLPPYRFAYVIEKAKSYAATVQGFGAALLSALEKKDVEELTLLRTVHEQNIMKMTKQVKQWEIDAADESIEGLIRRRETVQHRRDYYHSLIDEGLIPWENTQQISRHAVTISRVAEQALLIAAGITYTIPQVGSPFAMKYGGQEVGRGFHLAGWALRTAGDLSGSVAASAGLEASNQRRKQGWNFQLEQTEHELKELDKQIKGAKIHKDLAERSLEIHEKSLEQLNEVYEFYGEKFSNLGLYTWLSTTLQRLYREAYNSAYSMAKLAEQTYRFERSDNTSDSLSSGNWEAPKAGLLAGERLSIDLQNMERKFIETNYRSLEINQSFSLAQIAPFALIQLKETGECEFDIAEIYFDLFYPGHYRRKIKSARLTIPCVTGPYTNVSATLTLVGSNIRVEPKVGDDELKSVPRTRTLSIATSSAQNDAGVFELNFRDERYMPFEGAGAVSSWKLELPNKLRQFDYDTISDVIMHISYTAKDDGAFREKVEAEIENILIDYAQEKGLLRLFSMKREFSTDLHKFLHPPAANSGYETTLNITKKHFPYFLHDKSIAIQEQEIEVFLKLKDELQLQPVEFSITGNVDDGEWILSSGNVELIPENIEDIFILFKYTMLK